MSSEGDYLELKGTPVEHQYIDNDKALVVEASTVIEEGVYLAIGGNRAAEYIHLTRKQAKRLRKHLKAMLKGEVVSPWIW